MKTKNYFEGCTTEDELAARYKSTALIVHPDIAGGSEEGFRELGRQYAACLVAVRSGRSVLPVSVVPVVQKSAEASQVSKAEKEEPFWNAENTERVIDGVMSILSGVKTIIGLKK